MFKKLLYPRPMEVPFLGSWLTFRGNILNYMEDCHKYYGDIVFFNLFNLPCCVVYTPELIEEVFVKQSASMGKPWDLKELKVVLGEGLLTSEGELWKQQRKIIQPAFHNSRIRLYGDMMVNQTVKTLDSWQAGSRRDIHADLMQLTLEIVVQTLFGVDFSQQAHMVGQALDLFTEQFEAMMTQLIPLPLWVPTPNHLKMKTAIKEMDHMIAQMIEERRKSDYQGDDLLSWLLAARTSSGQPIRTQQIRDELVTLILAGHETTAIALSWTFMLLAQHPHIEQKVLEELDGVLGGKEPSAENVRQLTYTHQVVKESMRLYPPAYVIGREALEDIELGGYKIEKGTQIWLCQYVTQRDARYFEEPLTFKPERWSEENKNQHPKYAYFPFGGGPRSCVGMAFAMMEAVLIVACVLQRYKLKLVPDHPIEYQPSITLRPRYGIKVDLENRRALKPQLVSR